MLKVMHITESMAAAGGGTSTAFIEIIEALRTQSDSVEVSALSPRLEPGDESLRRIAHHDPSGWIWTGPPGRFRPGAFFERAAEELRRRRPDLLVAHGLWCTDIVALGRLAQALGILTVHHPHGMLVREALARSRMKKQVFRFLTGLPAVLRGSRAVVFATEGEVAGSDLSMLGTARRAVVPLPVPIEVSASELPALRAAGRATLASLFAAPVGPDDKVAIFVGRLHPVKRVELSLAALAASGQQNVRLLLVGDGEPAYVENLRALAQRLGLLHRIAFAGWRSGRDKWQLLAAADALLINSEFENFCYALVEALIAGVPVVATANLAMAPALVAAGGGLSAPGGAAALGAALGRLLALPAHSRAAMAAAGRTWVEQNFSRQAVGRAMLGVYRG
ncbi:MAG: glycosyltransferase [Phycisphaerales bacterium]